MVTAMAAPEIERRAEAGQLEQLRFLHHVARLATTARTWDELLETVVDGTRDALHADVTSLYLLDIESGAAIGAPIPRVHDGLVHWSPDSRALASTAASRAPRINGCASLLVANSRLAPASASVSAPDSSVWIASLSMVMPSRNAWVRSASARIA